MRTAALTASCYVVEEYPSCRRTKRHETGLEELRVANRKERVGQIDISVPQRQNFRCTQRSAIQQEKKRFYRRGLRQLNSVPNFGSEEAALAAKTPRFARGKSTTS